MRSEFFEKVVQDQLERSWNLLIKKGQEYTPGALRSSQTGFEAAGQANISPYDDEVETDRLAHFKKAAAMMNTTPRAALLGMLSKHLISVSDMCMDKAPHDVAIWDEKITDSINYLLLLRALVEEERYEQN